MGFPISPIVVNLFKEEFESKAISTAPIYPDFSLGMWMTLLLSNRQNQVSSSYTTSIPLTHMLVCGLYMKNIGVF